MARAMTIQAPDSAIIRTERDLRPTIFLHLITKSSAKSDDKKRARLNCMQDFLFKLDYPDKDWDVISAPDPLIVGSPSQVIRKDVHLDDWPHATSESSKK